MDRFKYLPKKSLNDLPKTSGVYSFKGKNELIYIGKAINIRERVKNHFQQPSYRDKLFMDKVTKIGYLETGSEIEALVTEASLIKKYQPKYNVLWRDDKNYFYVAIKENDKRIPYVYITHQKNGDAKYIGPFTEGAALKKTLRFLRRVFPYYSTKTHPKNKCLYCHLGLCPGPTPDLKEYKKNLKKLVLVLKGKRQAALSALKKEMKQQSATKKFEEAAKTRDRIFALQQVMAHTRVINASAEPKQPDLLPNAWENTQKTLQGLLDIQKPVLRIECYDISNIQGKQATGSMVVFTQGVADKNEYRKFKIKTGDKPNDIAMLKEVIARRFNHPEWQYPEIILIDGGIAQLNAAIEVKNRAPGTRDIKVISIAKKNRDLFIEKRGESVLLKDMPREVFNLVLQLDDEAHRFAITYHKALRKKNLLQ